MHFVGLVIANQLQRESKHSLNDDVSGNLPFAKGASFRLLCYTVISFQAIDFFLLYKDKWRYLIENEVKGVDMWELVSGRN